MEIGGSFWFGVAPKDGDPGDPGEPAMMYNIEASSDVITVDANGIVKRAVTYTLKKIVGSDSSPDANYFPWIRWYNGSVEIASKTPASKSESITLTESYPLATHVVMGFSGTYLGNDVTIKQFNIVRDNPLPFPRSEDWNIDLVFKNGEYLMYEDIVYMWGSPEPGNSPVNPKDDIINNPTTTRWKGYQNWPLLSTEVLLARFALLSGAVAADNKLFSQKGTINGGDSTNYRDENFVPNLLLNWLTGRLECDDAYIRGTIEALAGYIGNFVISEESDGRWLTDLARKMGLSGRQLHFTDDDREVYVGSVPGEGTGGSTKLVSLKLKKNGEALTPAYALNLYAKKPGILNNSGHNYALYSVGAVYFDPCHFGNGFVVKDVSTTLSSDTTYYGDDATDTFIFSSKKTLTLGWSTALPTSSPGPTKQGKIIYVSGGGVGGYIRFHDSSGAFLKQMELVGYEGAIFRATIYGWYMVAGKP